MLSPTNRRDQQPCIFLIIKLNNPVQYILLIYGTIQGKTVRLDTWIQGEKKSTDYLQTTAAQPVSKEKVCDLKCAIHNVTEAEALVCNCFPYGNSFASVCLLRTLYKQIFYSSGGPCFNFLKVTTALRRGTALPLHLEDLLIQPGQRYTF